MQWNELNLKRFITDDLIQPGFELNSVQPGFLCSSTEHRMFVDYSIGVNPDVGAYYLMKSSLLVTALLQDNYLIYDFVGRDPRRTPHGKKFYCNPSVPTFHQPSPDLLRDHCHQCVLRHVKGAGEVIDMERPFDPDLSSGGFTLEQGSWWSTLQGKKQLEAELSARLWLPS